VVRALAATALVALVAYPVRAFLFLDGLPWIVKAAWVAAFAQAIRWPAGALLSFLALVPLLPVVPQMQGWPRVSLGTAWLSALLLAAWWRYLWAPGPPLLPRAAVALLLLASASLATVLYPLQLGYEHPTEFAAAIQGYLSNDLIVARSQAPLLAPIFAWVVLAEGLALLWVVLFVGGAGQTRDRRILTRMTVALGIGAGLVSAWGIWQRWTGHALLASWAIFDPFLVRINASFTDVNALGSYLVSMLPVIVALTLNHRHWTGRLPWTAVAVAVLTSILFTGSRAAWAGAIASVAVLLIGLLALRIGPWSVTAERRLRRAAIGACAVLSLALVVLTTVATVRDVRVSEQRGYVDTILYTLNLQAPLNERLKGRLEFWRAGERMIAAHPLAGIGIGRFYKDLAAWAPDPDALIRRQENAHNYFLQVAAEQGLPALAAFLGLLATALWYPLRVLRQRAAPETKRLALAAAAGVMGFSITCLTGHPLLIHEGQLTFWPLVGLAMLLGGAGGTLSEPRPWRAAGFIVPALAAVLLLTLPGRLASTIEGVDTRLFGVYAQERSPSGQVFRWTGPRAVVDIPAAARVASLEMRAIAPFAQRVEIWYEGRLIHRASLAGAGWQMFRYVMPQSHRGTFRRFELRVHPTWRPAGDSRDLGIMLGTTTWSS
jgi:O-antigen ligase